MGLNRRAFCRSSAFAVLGLSLPLVGRAGNAGSRTEQQDLGPALARLRALFAEPDQAHRIGSRFLALFPGQSDPLQLFAAAGLDPQWPADRMRRTLEARRARDFETGATVVIDGWLLSRSAVCACGLIALT